MWSAGLRPGALRGRLLLWGAMSGSMRVTPIFSPQILVPCRASMADWTASAVPKRTTPNRSSGLSLTCQQRGRLHLDAKKTSTYLWSHQSRARCKTTLVKRLAANKPLVQLQAS